MTCWWTVGSHHNQHCNNVVGQIRNKKTGISSPGNMYLFLLILEIQALEGAHVPSFSNKGMMQAYSVMRSPARPPLPSSGGQSLRERNRVNSQQQLKATSDPPTSLLAPPYQWEASCMHIFKKVKIKKGVALLSVPWPVPFWTLPIKTPHILKPHQGSECQVVMWLSYIFVIKKKNQQCTKKMLSINNPLPSPNTPPSAPVLGV